MSRRPVVLLLSSLAVLLCGAAPAAAATVTRAATTVTYTAAAGVTNELYADEPAANTVRFFTDNDPVATNTLPENCTDADGTVDASATVVTCTNTTSVVINLGDRNDYGETAISTIAVTVNGEGDDDQLYGGSGADTFNGGDGADEVYGGEGADTLSGDAGADNLDGQDGADIVDGGSGPDILQDSDFAVDTLRGGSGADIITGLLAGVGDTYDGGDGIDSITYFTAQNETRTVLVDLQAGKGGSSDELDTLAGFEDIGQGYLLLNLVIPITTTPTKLIGNASANRIVGGSAADDVTAGAGNDTVDTGDGDDTVALADGFADRVICGEGADTVTADQFDVVDDSCETVTRTQTANANDTPEDAAPKVAITSPSSSAVLSTTAPNTITANASDDKGIKQVIFSTGERTLCVDTTAPYSCDYRPTAADVGRDTIIAVAVDTAEQTASAVRSINVPRFKATGLSAATSPKRDRKAPYTFATKGKLALPFGVQPAAGCKGVVDVSFKAGKKTVSSRRVALKSNCTYSSKVTFRLPARLNPKTLTVVVVFGGNDVLDAINAKRHTVRPR